MDALGDFLPQFGIHTDFVKHINDLAEVESKIGPDTRAIFAETVANPSTEILDIEPLSQLAHEHGIALIVDNTAPTPYLLRPIEFGADIVVHSTTKGITGHGNAIGGAVIDSGHLDWVNGRFPPPNSPHGSRSSAMIATVNGTVLPKDTATRHSSSASASNICARSARWPARSMRIFP
ncbi:PLP-dependent transferase [Bifidobacterium longum]|uniref:PLP-dependent transferase n=1 Tax=Bifidobacterium longum TaxID=216816 RepID=UPI002E17CC71|nr:PLP-dependent transferase [Bifidobacterium longum]